MAQLRMAATSQQLYYVDQNTYAGDTTNLEAHGFKQGEQVVTVGAADASTYCMQAPGGAESRSGSPRIRTGLCRAHARSAPTVGVEGSLPTGRFPLHYGERNFGREKELARDFR
jgi:hypothetical protein